MKKMNQLAKMLLIQSILAIVLWSGPAVAQISIVATVNGHPITNYDVEQRARFLEFATNIRINDENRDRVFEDALQLLIDDRLRLEEAKGMIPDVESSVLPEARNFMNQNFGDGNRSGAIILREAGIDPMTVQQKYTSDIAWSSYVSTRFQEKFSNIEIMIDEELARMKLNAAKPQIQLAEIVLAPGQ
jgi:peptidyl-prolyl cis-trans isomerase SurA